MTATLGQPGTRPVVAVLYRVPLFVEALHGIFDGFADVHAVHADADAESVVRWLRPDALVLDGDTDGFPLAWAGETGGTVVRVNLQEPEVTVLRNGAWEVSTTDSSPNAVRNAVLAGLAGERA